MGAACACCTRSTTGSASPNQNCVASHSPDHQATVRNAEGRTHTSGDASGSGSGRARQPPESSLSSSQQSLYNRRKVAHAPPRDGTTTTTLRLQEEDLGPSSDAPSVSQPVPVANIVPSPLHTQTTQSIVDTWGEGPTEDIVDLIINTEDGTDHNTTVSRSSLSSGGGIVGGRCPPGRTAVVRRGAAGAAGPVVAALQDTSTSGSDAPLTVHNERQYATTPTSFTVVDGLPHEQCEQNAVTPSSTTMGNPTRGGGGGGGRVMFRNPSDESMRVTSSVASPAGGGGGGAMGGSVVAVVSFPDLPPMPESSTPSLSHQPLHQLTTETSGDPSLFNQSSCGSGTKSSLQLSETAVQRFRSDLIHNSGGNNSSTTTTTTTSTTTTSGSLTSARGSASVTTPLPPCASSSSGDSSGGGLIGAPPTRSPSIPEFPGSK